MPARPFIDTNIIVYAFAAGHSRSEAAEQVIAAGGVISVQVLNEFTNVSQRKLGLSWPEIDERIEIVRALLDVDAPLGVAEHDKARALARDHTIAFYDALIIASALSAGCNEVLSEDMQHGRRIEGLTIRNPFA